MRHLLLRLLVVVVVAAAAGRPAALGDFTGLMCRPHIGEEWTANGYEGLTTYRVYASFDDPEDVLLLAGGTSGLLFVLEPSGGVFHNAEFDSAKAPRDLRFAGIWENQWDTYVTIDTDTADGDETVLSVGFTEQTDGLRGPVSTDFAAWFISPDALPQGLADGGLVLVAQLTLPCGDGVSGLMAVFPFGGDLLPDQAFQSPPLDDCNANCLSDALEIEMGLVRDCNTNGVPDGCEDLPCLRADLDCNGDVNFGDVLRVLVGWGPCDACREDIDGDGMVGFSDLLFILANHGACA